MTDPLGGDGLPVKVGDVFEASSGRRFTVRDFIGDFAEVRDGALYSAIVALSLLGNGKGNGYRRVTAP